MDYGEPGWLMAIVEMRLPVMNAEPVTTEKGVRFRPSLIELHWVRSSDSGAGRNLDWHLTLARLFGPKISRRDDSLLQTGEQIKWERRHFVDEAIPDWALKAADEHHPSKYDLHTSKRKDSK